LSRSATSYDAAYSRGKRFAVDNQLEPLQLIDEMENRLSYKDDLGMNIVHGSEIWHRTNDALEPNIAGAMNIWHRNNDDLALINMEQDADNWLHGKDDDMRFKMAPAKSAAVQAPHFLPTKGSEFGPSTLNCDLFKRCMEAHSITNVAQAECTRYYQLCQKRTPN
jgi:hypothetical protein